MKVCHDSHKLEYRNPFGAVEINENISLALDVEDVGWNCNLKIWSSGEPVEIYSMNEEFLPPNLTRFSINLQLDHTPKIMWYCFQLQHSDGRTMFYGNNENSLGGKGKLYENDVKPYQITVYKENITPKWYKNSVIYQIFPDRFNRSENWFANQNIPSKKAGSIKRFVHQDWYDTPVYTKNTAGEVTRWGFFGGDLCGIKDKLYYLKSQGVGTIYLNPIFEATSNHKYDTADYYKIDPCFGTEVDLENLIECAKNLGISIILDGVFNHTGADSIYFNKFNNYANLGAWQGENSPYYKWFTFDGYTEKNLVDGVVADLIFEDENLPEAGENSENLLSTDCTLSENLDFVDVVDEHGFVNGHSPKYKCWWGVEDLPGVNENEASYQEFIYDSADSVVKHWLKKGIKGWRLDVVDELPGDFLKGIYTATKEVAADNLILGEVWEDASNKESYGEPRQYLLGGELDATMNYPYRKIMLEFVLNIKTANDVCKSLLSLQENYPKSYFYSVMNLLGTHDCSRILTVLGEADENLSDMEKEYYRLPDEKLELAKKRLKFLATLQFCSPGVPSIYYGDEAGAQGFADPFNRGTFPWGNEEAELQEHFRNLAYLRGEYPALVDGDFKPLYFEENVYGFLRTLQVYKKDKNGTYIIEEKILILGNRSDRNVFISFDLPENYVLDLLTSEEFETKEGSVDVNIPAYGVRVLYLKNVAPKPLGLPRLAGVLCHVSSIPSKGEHGILGREAKQFIDYMAGAGQKIWQILPLNPVDASNSPYSSPAAFAGETKFIDPDLELRLDSGFDIWCANNSYWLEDYALYMVIYDNFGGKPWNKWPEAERNRKNLNYYRENFKYLMENHKKKQYNFFKQWQAIKEYANVRGIKIVGDLPIYVAAQSVDVWAHQDLFFLDADGEPAMGAGVPPDYFSEEGQHWGNPIYNWEKMAEDDYLWWRKRFEQAQEMYDYIRLDHFRSFSAYYAIPRGLKPKDGYWFKGVGKKFFDVIETYLGKLPILAEDLGSLDAGVYNLLKLTGYSGMNVYQFSAREMEEMPNDVAKNRIFYTGTHDNQTLMAWVKENFPEIDADEAISGIFEGLYSSAAAFVIVPIQDVLRLGDEARLNVPGVAAGNWTWQLSGDMLRLEQAMKWKKMVVAAYR